MAVVYLAVEAHVNYAGGGVYMPTTAPAAPLLLTGISDMAGFWSRKKRKKI